MAAGLEAELSEAAEAHRAGRLDEAEIVLRRAAKRHAERYEPLALLAYVLQDMKVHSEAAQLLERVLAMAPDAPGIASALALSLKALGRAREAIPALERTVERLPGDAEALANLGGLYREVGRIDEALDVLKRAVARAPDWVPALNNLGNALLAAARPKEAIEALERASMLDPTRASIVGNLGVAYKSAGKLRLAAATQERAIALDPGFADGHLNLGDALLAAGEVERAVEAFRKSATLAPANPAAFANVVFALDYDPMATQEDMAEARRLWNERFARPLMPTTPALPDDPDPDRPLRVGYVSAGFARGSVGSVVVPLIKGHDPHNVVAIAYSDTARVDDIGESLRSSVIWRDIRGMTDAKLAGAVRADAVDILVDLSAHMAGSRLLAFARKPAPIQITGWGNAVGTGLDAMDWFMADDVVVPPGDEKYFSERIFRLRSWLCFEAPAHAPKPPRRRRSRGTPPVFGYFNRLSKLSPDSIAAWCRILRQVPGSRMLLKYRGLDDPEIRAPFVAAFGRGGVAPDRLDFRGATGQYEHVATFAEVDVVLDPFPHGGGVTALEGLWMNTPPIALRAPRPSGRTTASLLHSVGCPELIAETVDDYVAMAVALAGDAERLGVYHATLSGRLSGSPVMDMRAYVAEVEAAYREMWREALSRSATR